MIMMMMIAYYINQWWKSRRHEALNGEEPSRGREAMESEYSSLLKNDTWNVVLHLKQRT